MDVALLHSLLEANCSLALAEELFWDSWAQPLDPEGRREANEPRRRGLLLWRAGCLQGPALRVLCALHLAAPRDPGKPSKPHSVLSPSPGPYSYCNATLDQIGTCWPRSAARALVERPCPEYFNGVKYNTTRECPRPSVADSAPTFQEDRLGDGGDS